MPQENSPHQRLLRFFELLGDEAFDEGRREARAEARAQHPQLYPLLEQLEDDPMATSLPDGLSVDECLICFSGCYFSARSIIESSYRYRHAEQLIERAVEALDGVTGAINTDFIEVLREFARLQGAICNIDRGIYQSLASTMGMASTELGEGVERLLQLRTGLNGLEAELYDEHLASQLAAYHCYADAIKSVAELYGLRWGDGAVLQQAVDIKLPSIERALRELESMGARIMATDLAPHVPVLHRFAERQQADSSGKLCIEHGRMRIAYFASLHHNMMKPFAALMAETLAAGGTEGMSLKGLGASSLESDSMSDIWSGLASRDFIDTYSWQFPPLTLPFRGSELNFTVELTYFSMGIFVLNLSSDLSQLSVSGLRHAMSLGTPYAVDEQIRCEQSGEQFAFFEEFSDHALSLLSSELKLQLGEHLPEEARALNWNSSDNRFVSVRLERVVSDTGEQRHELDIEALQNHIGYPAIALPLREVRSAVDDWILRPAPDASENLAPLRYNENELMMVQRHGTVMALLQQPDWVREQAAESVEVAAAITNLFQLTNTVLGKHIRQLAVEGPQEKGAGESLFCESLFWASKPKQTAKTSRDRLCLRRPTSCVRCVITSSRLYTLPQ
ncbi:hypothetical protein [Candidatus Reidiella endopervernicosa]|uniref:Uncharacterized protein n=1 Tax=Candidatus Reidiella endopervernicosa TaxID=2738883 RepID=A0A6N0I078_9GAMM|nr:hypothetical protein [Candidatus Reidiella endopervernicosa]QKQ28032.1 hypothetical protein HUE57_18380 [Candidatus Reidiella endopervernicosa]